MHDLIKEAKNDFKEMEIMNGLVVNINEKEERNHTVCKVGN